MTAVMNGSACVSDSSAAASIVGRTMAGGSGCCTESRTSGYTPRPSFWPKKVGRP